MRAEHRGGSWLCLVHLLQEAQPLSAAVKDELLPELLQDSVIFYNERRVEAADGFRAAVGREGSLEIKVTKQSAAPSTCKIGLIFLISVSLDNGCFQKKFSYCDTKAHWFQWPLLWMKWRLMAPLPTQKALKCRAQHGIITQVYTFHKTAQ